MGSAGQSANMSLLLLLLPVALAGLPPHHQKLLTDLEQKMSTLTKMCEPPSVTLAWKSQLRAMEEPRSISPTGLVALQEMALFGRTWFPSGLQTTLSTSHLTQCQTLSSTTSSGSSQRLLEDSTQV